ncbi:MAG: hypothetical protein AABY22_13290 [Nanoarchaeota archaeon]
MKKLHKEKIAWLEKELKWIEESIKDANKEAVEFYIKEKRIIDAILNDYKNSV